MTNVSQFRISFTNSKHNTQYTTKKALGEEVTYDFCKMVRRKLCPTKCGCVAEDIICAIGSTYTVNKSIGKPAKYYIIKNGPTKADTFDPDMTVGEVLATAARPYDKATQARLEKKGYDQGYKEAWDLAYAQGVADTQRDAYKRGRRNGRTEGRKLAEQSIENRLSAAKQDALAQWAGMTSFEQAYESLKRMRIQLTNVQDANHKPADKKLEVRWTITLKHLQQALEELEDLTLRGELTLDQVEIASAT